MYIQISRYECQLNIYSKLNGMVKSYKERVFFLVIMINVFRLIIESYNDPQLPITKSKQTNK